MDLSGDTVNQVVVVAHGAVGGAVLHLGDTSDAVVGHSLGAFGTGQAGESACCVVAVGGGLSVTVGLTGQLSGAVVGPGVGLAEGISALRRTITVIVLPGFEGIAAGVEHATYTPCRVVVDLGDLTQGIGQLGGLVGAVAEPGPEAARGWLAVSVNRTVPRPALAAPTTGYGAHHGVSAFVWPAPRSGGRVESKSAQGRGECMIRNK